jgi:dTDP-4-amino-4,6-dideoxygalactose transaminase
MKMEWKIPLFKIYWDDKDIDAVTKIIKRGTYWTTGPENEKLEKSIASFVHNKYALTFNSGTSALHANLLAHGITSGEVIVPSFTFIATANTVVLAGAKPLFADIEEESYGLDPEDVKAKISANTKAIIPVHYGGNSCKHIKALRDISEDHDLVLIEDAAESLGAKLDEQMVGSFGHSSMFSFCHNKIITAGEGGIIVTDSKKLYEKLKLIRSHGRLEGKEGYFATTKELDYIQAGYNYRMSTITASLVLSQYQKIEKIIKMRREKAQFITKKLASLKEVRLPQEAREQHHVYQMYTIQLENKKIRNGLQQQLNKSGIMTKVYFEPLHLKTYYKQRFKYTKGCLPKTEKVAEKVLSLPIFPTLTSAEMEYMTDVIQKYFR